MSEQDFNLIGQTLDEKYKIERELGRGGMGAVYLATHIGTERPVAVKVVAPEFMRRQEFVERFRREARAAGRLRHPNVVDVTDFGIAKTDLGERAYLVMEYLDGCTLGEVLEEEKKLPLSWTLDILEQTCAAVSEAHRQGIIHRDLKPDNIWLEPNERGGYTVKVLDFGIAKLEETINEEESFATSNFEFQISDGKAENQTSAFFADAKMQNAEFKLQNQETLILPAESATLKLESRNDGFSGDSSKKTTNKNLSAANTAALTRAGAILGTPLYMSPEQCRGERLDARSDIYSLGVIAYQMLAGELPFAGNYNFVLKAHQENAPPRLENRRVPRKVKRIVAAALSKNPNERPPTAQAFANQLRSSSEGIGALLRRALMIYSEHLPTFLGLALLLLLPVMVLHFVAFVLHLLLINNLLSETAHSFLTFAAGLASMFANIFFGSVIIGVTTWIVAQHLAVPLRPVNRKTALLAAAKKWRTFAFTVTLAAVSPFLIFLLGGTLIGTILAVVAGVKTAETSKFIEIAAAIGIGLATLASLIFGFILFIRLHLVAPVVLMENLRGRAAFRRSWVLVGRARRTVAAAVFLNFFLPLILAMFIMLMSSAILKADQIFKIKTKPGAVQIILKDDTDAPQPQPQMQSPESSEGTEKENKTKIQSIWPDVVFQIFWIPMLIFVSSLSAVVTGLLYLKTRQAGGENLKELLTKFAENDRAEKRWQQRLKSKLEQSGKNTNR
jgi:serine/threonine protein kinase